MDATSRVAIETTRSSRSERAVYGSVRLQRGRPQGSRSRQLRLHARWRRSNGHAEIRRRRDLLGALPTLVGTAAADNISATADDDFVVGLEGSTGTDVCQGGSDVDSAKDCAVVGDVP